VVSLLATGGGGFILLVGSAVVDPAVTVSPISYIEAFATVNSDTSLGFYLYFLITAVAMLVLAVIGLLQIVLWKKSNKNSHAGSYR